MLKLRCSIVTHLNTGIYNNATNRTINYIHNTDGGDKNVKKVKGASCKCMTGVNCSVIGML